MLQVVQCRPLRVKYKINGGRSPSCTKKENAMAEEYSFPPYGEEVAQGA